MNPRARQSMPVVEVTGETITDEEIVELLTETVADCYVALHGTPAPTTPRQKLQRTKSGPAYHAARTRLATLITGRKGD